MDSTSTFQESFSCFQGVHSQTSNFHEIASDERIRSSNQSEQKLGQLSDMTDFQSEKLNYDRSGDRTRNPEDSDTLIIPMCHRFLNGSIIHTSGPHDSPFFIDSVSYESLLLRPHS